MADTSRVRRVIPFAIFGLVFALGLALAWALQVSSAAQRRARLMNDAETVVRAIEVGMAQHVAVLRAVKALLEVDPERMTRERFANFAAKIDLPTAYPGMRGVGFAQITSLGDEDKVRRQFDLPRYVHPATTQRLRAPIVLLEPRDERNVAALAFDMYSEPRRRAAMEMAELSDQPVATEPVILAQEITTDVQSGFLVYVPTRDATGKVFGFAYAPFRVGEFLAGVGLRKAMSNYVLTLDDVTHLRPMAMFSSSDAATDGAEIAAREVEIASRRWRVSISPNIEASPILNLLTPLGVAILALILAFLVAHAYRDEQRAQEIESALAQTRLKALADREILLQEMNHRIKNAIARIAAIARSTARGSANLEEFQATFSGRLAAMASAQDLVTRGDRAGALLEDVLHAELDQLFSASDERLSLSGAPTRLDSRHTQALALVFHELATNAAKHGAARDPTGRLAVKWRRRDDGALAISWDETRAAAEPTPERKGFGSRLIKLIVEEELKGSLRREVRPEGLTLVLELPSALVEA